MTDPTPEERTRIRAGAGAAVTAFTLWGISPAYYRLLLQFGAFEVVVHRIMWSAIFLGGIIAANKGFGEVWARVKNPKVLRLLCISTVLIAINWLLFIWATMNGRVLDASLEHIHKT